jgi:hypothetical protein
MRAIETAFIGHDGPPTCCGYEKAREGLALKLYRADARCYELTKPRISMFELILVAVAICLIATGLAVSIAHRQNKRDNDR